MRKLTSTFAFLALLFTLIIPVSFTSTGADGSAQAATTATTAAPVQRRQRRARRARGYMRGPRGGCYYINRNGRKTYVARSLCR